MKKMLFIIAVFCILFLSGCKPKIMIAQEIANEVDGGVALAKTIMYASIVILTITFTFQYLKRVIFMAFYTLIAPLITLTYPLDKIKDGQAQAFSMWIKEYIES